MSQFLCVTALQCSSECKLGQKSLISNKFELQTDFPIVLKSAVVNKKLFFMSFFSRMFSFHSFMFSFSTSYDLISCCLALDSSGVSDGWRGLWHIHTWCALLWCGCSHCASAPSLPPICSAVWPRCSPRHISPLPHADRLQHGWALLVSRLTATHIKARFSPQLTFKTRFFSFLHPHPPFVRSRFVFFRHFALTGVIKFRFFILFFLFFMLLSCWHFIPAHWYCSANCNLCCYYSALPNVDWRDCA